MLTMSAFDGIEQTITFGFLYVTTVSGQIKQPSKARCPFYLFFNTFKRPVNFLAFNRRQFIKICRVSRR